MKWNMNLILFVWCLLFNQLLVAGVSDIDCTVGCVCCIEQKCEYKYEFNNTCSIGCIDGYAGARCYKKCPENCIKCKSDKNIETCEDCKDGFYPGTSNDCTSKCLHKCKTCTSGSSCTSCKEEYYNDNGSDDCQYFRCPGNCKCESDQCSSCMEGYYNTSNTCNSSCPGNCVTCSSSTYCEECNDNYYKGYRYDDRNLPVLNDCTYKCRKNCKKCSSYNRCSVCEAGRYGTICEKYCSDGCATGICDRQTGKCDNCTDFFTGEKCDKCQNGRYGDMCEKDCSVGCKGNVCGKVSGYCIDGCFVNFHGDLCNSFCSSACKTGKETSKSQCQQTDGKCLYGCDDGYYGMNCSQNCSKLCKDKICNQDDGTCTNGCQTKMKNDLFCPLVSASKPQEEDGSPIGAIVGAVVGVLVAVAVVVAGILYRRRQIGQSKEERPDLEETKPSRSSRNAEQTHTYGNISAAENAESKTNARKERKSASILTAVDKRHSVNDIRQPSVVSASLNVNDIEINEERDDDQNDDPYYNITDSPYRIKVVNLLKYVTSKTIDFEAEFKKLNKDLDLTKHCSVAKQPENIALNRYNGIYPYDHSRVTIPDIPDFFMNACYIDGYCKGKEYIASLGPTSKTSADFSSFWLMVWYEKTDIIVMLTNLRESSGMKCEQYWPEAETENVYGEITVKCRSIEEFAEYNVRTFTILKGKERRQVIQLHYTACPDKGVPKEVTSLVEFRQRVNVVPKTLGGPIIVHCSAGVGRTGTYIALDTLTKEGKGKGFVDVFECVNRMRYQRVNMVQTAQQYKFLHKALCHSLSFGCETMTAEEIQKIMYEADANTFSNIYKSLAQEVDTETKDELTAREENKKRQKDKNRRHSCIPGDTSRVRLFLARKVGQHDYINAVFINSFRIKNLFIASQTPLPGTIEDFLSMIFQQNTACVVALEDHNNHSKDIGQYLPADNETYTFGHFSVTSSKNETKSQYILKNLTVKDHAKDQKKSVYHFQFKNWQTLKKVPDNATEFVQFIKEVEKYVSKDPEDQPNIIAHCLNGFERTGLFCIVYKLLEKLEAERQVSVVNTVRKIRTHRSQSITSVEQLKFCFECISAYLETYSIYTNFAS